MKRFLFFVILAVNQPVFAQNEVNHWFFGNYASLDFNSGTPVVGNCPMITNEGTASISNSLGELLFYTNGVEVYDSTNTIMSNGSNLKGNISTTQSALIVPSPSNVSQYYIFTADADGGPNGLCYSIVDMSLNGGYGDVTATKNVLLTDSISEKIASIKIPSIDAYWIVTHKYGTNQFLAYYLDGSGLMAPVVSSVGTIHNTSTFQNTFGQMKFNLCGDKLALALGYMDQVDIYDFNITTGVVSNPIILPMSDHVYGIEFSPSSQYLYVTCYDDNSSLVQFDVSLATQTLIQASMSSISATDFLYGMQLGPDGKIYVARSFGTSYLGIINSPELAGFACNYVDNGIDLDPNFNGYNGGLSLPSFMQSFLGSDPNCVLPNDIYDSEISNEYELFPNPSIDGFYFNSDFENYNLELFNITGKRIFSKNDIVNLKFGEELPQGIYFLSITKDDYSEVKKLIKD